MSDVLPTHLDLWQNTLQWQPNEAQQALFQQLYTHIVAGNQRFNLTRITTSEDFWEKHLWDSISALAPWLTDMAAVPAEATSNPAAPAEALLDAPIRLIDIGTGGGIPGLPCAIASGSCRAT